MNALLEQLEASRPAREQQKHAEFQQLGDDAASHDQSIFEQKKAGRADIAAELEALDAKLSEMESRYIEAQKRVQSQTA